MGISWNLPFFPSHWVVELPPWKIYDLVNWESHLKYVNWKLVYDTSNKKLYETSKVKKLWLVGGFNMFQPTYPSEKWWSSSVGMMTFPTEWTVITKPPTRWYHWVHKKRHAPNLTTAGVPCTGPVTFGHSDAECPGANLTGSCWIHS